jgi:Fic family protein
MTMQDALGFGWDERAVARAFRGIRPRDPERAAWRFRQSLAEYVWDAAVLEGNAFTYPEVQTLLDGVTVGGRKLTDERQVLNLAEAAGSLAETVLTGAFEMSKPTSDHFHYLIARDEAFDAGGFRGEGHEMMTPSVYLGGAGRYTPPATERGGANLRAIYEQGIPEILELPGPLEQAVAYFLFGALMQFYFDGNKRTARYMANGWLMAHGYDAISIPAARRLEFNELMIPFYRDKDGTAMAEFLASCYPGG